MERPIVSVMMLTYNHAAYIEKAIESIVSQETEFPFELVIGEDCSTDGTRGIVDRYKEQYPDIVRIVTSNKNVGAIANSTRTLKALRGDFLALCEGDDFWHRKDKLQLQTEVLLNDPECVLVCSDYDRHYIEQNKTLHNYFQHRDGELPQNADIEQILRGQGCILTCTTLSRLELVRETIGSDPFLHTSGHFAMGDTQLWAELSLHGSIRYIHDSLATRRITGESATRSRNLQKEILFWSSNLEMILYLCKKHSLTEIDTAHLERDRSQKLIKLAILQDNPECILELSESIDRKTATDRVLELAGHVRPLRHYLKNYFERKHAMRDLTKGD